MSYEDIDKRLKKLATFFDSEETLDSFLTILNKGGFSIHCTEDDLNLSTEHFRKRDGMRDK